MCKLSSLLREMASLQTGDFKSLRASACAKQALGKDLISVPGALNFSLTLNLGFEPPKLLIRLNNGNTSNALYMG